MIIPEPAIGETTQQPPCQGVLLVGLASDPGRVRERNEDACLVWQFLLTHQGQPPLPLGVFAIADGMGGQSRGGQASGLAIRLASGHVIRQLGLPLLNDGEGLTARPPIHEVLESSIQIAHEAVLRRLPEAGTTMTMAFVLGDSVYIAHVGDSRVYLGERGQLRCLTQDHSVAARLVEMGQATSDEVAQQRNLLYKAIGQGSRIEPDVAYHDLAQGQYLLLCCDGLWTCVSDEEIAAIIESADSPSCACQKLIARANESGGDDNISVILAATEWPLPERELSGRI